MFHHIVQLPSPSSQAPLCQAETAWLWNGQNDSHPNLGTWPPESPCTTLFIRPTSNYFLVKLETVNDRESLTPRRTRHNKRPQNQHHELENLTIALDAVTDDGIKLVNIGRKNRKGQKSDTFLLSTRVDDFFPRSDLCDSQKSAWVARYVRPLDRWYARCGGVFSWRFERANHHHRRRAKVSPICILCLFHWYSNYGIVMGLVHS